MRWRGVGAMGDVGRGGWGVGVVLVLTVWLGGRSMLELSGGGTVRLERPVSRPLCHHTRLQRNQPCRRF
jgi:hypothetical protein